MKWIPASPLASLLTELSGVRRVSLSNPSDWPSRPLGMPPRPRRELVSGPYRLLPGPTLSRPSQARLRGFRFPLVFQPIAGIDRCRTHTSCEDAPASVKTQWKHRSYPQLTARVMKLRWRCSSIFHTRLIHPKNGRDGSHRSARAILAGCFVSWVGCCSIALYP